MFTASVFKWRHFLPEIILLNVRWYCRYTLSHRDLEQMMAERGIEVDHSTRGFSVLNNFLQHNPLLCMAMLRKKMALS
jgi:transposase-like protein